MDRTEMAAVPVTDDPQVAASPRGGMIAKSGGYQFEVFFYPTGIRLFPRLANGDPVSVTSLGASATFLLPKSPTPWFVRHLVATPAAAGHPEASLDLGIDLSRVPATGITVAFELTGLPGSQGKPVEFSTPFHLLGQAVQETPAATQASPTPGYVYGPGYHGYRYYPYPGPQAAPVQAAAPAVYSYANEASRATHDWSTGRAYQNGGLIDKPWLTPIMD